MWSTPPEVGAGQASPAAIEGPGSVSGPKMLCAWMFWGGQCLCDSDRSVCF